MTMKSDNMEGKDMSCRIYISREVGYYCKERRMYVTKNYCDDICRIRPRGARQMRLTEVKG